MTTITIHHGKVDNRVKLYSCPYHSELFYNFHIFPVPNMKTATALYIYYEIFYPKSRDRVYQSVHPLWRIILGVRARSIKVTDEYSLFLKWISSLPFKSLPQKGLHRFKNKKEFIAEARDFILTSHKWDWVVPHLRKTYPSLLFGELQDDT